MKTKMTLEFATALSNQWINLLQPACEMIQVAGSIRRKVEQVGDIDIVCVPRTEPIRNLFGGEVGVRNLAHEAISKQVEKHKDIKWIRGGDAPGDLCSFDVPGCQIDVYFTDREHWGATLLTRTGPKEHNIWFSKFAAAYGGKWSSSRGLTTITGERVSASEEEIYDALGLTIIDPERRYLAPQMHPTE